MPAFAAIEAGKVIWFFLVTVDVIEKNIWQGKLSSRAKRILKIATDIQGRVILFGIVMNDLAASWLEIEWNMQEAG